MLVEPYNQSLFVADVSFNYDARKPDLSEHDQVRYMMRHSPSYNRAVVAFAGYIERDHAYASFLPEYYRSQQESFIQKMHRHVPSCMKDVQELFVGSYVAGHDPAVAALCDGNPKKLPFVESAAHKIIKIVANGDDIQKAKNYLNEVEDHNRLRINAGLLIRHELGWISQLAHREGSSQARYEARIA